MNAPAPGEENFLFPRDLINEDTIDLLLMYNVADDLDRLADLWSTPDRKAEVLDTLIKKLAKSSRPYVVIPVREIMPPFISHRVGTLPIAKSLNCFNAARNSSLICDFDDDNSESALNEHLRIHYDKVQGPPRFGDILLYHDGANLVHAAFYLANDFVFTKNGMYHSAHIFERLEDNLAFYKMKLSDVSYYRKKEFLCGQLFINPGK